MIYAGIDAGSRATKVVLWDATRRAVLAQGAVDQGIEQQRLAHELFARLIEQHQLGFEAVQRIVATGYGRNLIDFANTTVTEITCHACGVRYLAPLARTIIEIGGQDSKLIRLDGHGNVRDFAMNDRCAAGTGRFLEIAAARLGTSLADLGPLAGQSGSPAVISTMCAVFAETEIVGLLAGGRKRADIVAGIQAAIAGRVAGMAGRQCEGPVYFTGGVAQVSGMSEALEAVLKQPVSVVPQPVFSGALGAALLAANER